MEFLSSPLHSYSYETFDDGIFEIPKEMDLEMNDEFRDSVTYSIDEEDDFNDGLYGVWSSKHPWGPSNNSNSLYNSSLHLDFIGGGPESAIMVNPNVVIPNGVLFEEDNIKVEETIIDSKDGISSSIDTSEHVSSIKIENVRSLNVEASTIEVKKVKPKFLSLKDTISSAEQVTTALPKNGIRVLKPAVVESGSPNSRLEINQTKTENGNSRTKSTLTKNGNSKYRIYCSSDQFYPKPAFSYSCLIAMALKNSKHGCLPVAEIYNFMCNHFPYFKTAPTGWKNSVRHNLSLNKCFEKIEKPAGSTQRKGCLWALNPSKAAKLEEEVQKCTKKDVVAIKRAMEYPEHLELLEKGELKSLYDTEHVIEDDEEDMDTNEEDDTEGEEPVILDDNTIEDGLSENGDEELPKVNATDEHRYTTLNEIDSNDLPEFNIEVDDSIYEELMGSIKNEQLYTMNSVPLSSSNGSFMNPQKKIKKYVIQVSGGAEKGKKSESEIFDHYDINNFLRLENESKLLTSRKTPPRFNKRLSPNARIKQIKFKTWD